MASDQPAGRQRLAARESGTALVRLFSVVAAASVLVSGYVHFYLYFRGGYRDIHPESVLGLTISRSFAINAIAALVIAEAWVISLRRPALTVPAGLATVGFAATTLGAFILSRTTGLLGFTETRTTTEAIIALIAETAAILAVLGLAKARFGPRTAP